MHSTRECRRKHRKGKSGRRREGKEASMKLTGRLLAGAAVVLVVAAACARTGGGGGGGGGEGGGAIPRGGTLRLDQNTDVCNAFDPQKAYCSINWEYTRIMLRTLLSYNGLAADEGGVDVKPDLAVDLPQVSEDGLTWTFEIKPGLHWGPPLEDVEITAQDFIRALEREADPEASTDGYAFYYSPIVGFDDFGAGKADSIEGLSAPDDHTLVVNISEPLGDMIYRFTMAATAPIPPHPDNPHE